jgi:hypothetical protein
MYYLCNIHSRVINIYNTYRYNKVFNNTLNNDNSLLISERQDFKDQFVSNIIENKINLRKENLKNKKFEIYFSNN